MLPIPHKPQEGQSRYEGFGYVNATLMGGHHFFWRALAFHPPPASSAFTRRVAHRTYHFNQIDARCENGAQADTVKSCGLVIHEGMSCDSPGDPLTMTGGCGGIQADWANSYYISTPCTSPTCSPAFINGYPRGNSFIKNAADENFVIDDYIGRVFMAYDFEGQPMACSTLQAAVPASDGGSLVAGHAEGWGYPGSKFGQSARASHHVPRAPACAARTESWCVARCRRCSVSSGRSRLSERITQTPSSRGS